MRRALFVSLFLYAGVASAQEVFFRFPGADQHRQFFNITAYRDNSGDGNGLQDWNCGGDTYDGHRGTDMGVGGFAGMDAGRDIVASADGTVVTTNDGVDDRCTTGNCAGGSGFGNFVVREKKERIGRNPQTGDPIPISARRVLTFKPSQVLKNVLNPDKIALRQHTGKDLAAGDE